MHFYSCPSTFPLLSSQAVACIVDSQTLTAQLHDNALAAPVLHTVAWQHCVNNATKTAQGAAAAHSGPTLLSSRTVARIPGSSMPLSQSLSIDWQCWTLFSWSGLACTGVQKADRSKACADGCGMACEKHMDAQRLQAHLMPTGCK